MMFKTILHFLMILFCVINNLLCFHVHAYGKNNTDIIRDDIQNLMMQFASAMNIRKKSVINDFINYYADDSALFQKTSMLLDSDNESIVKAERIYKLNKYQYIEHLYNISATPIQYAFAANISNIQIDKDQQFAIATVYIEEDAINRIQANMNVKIVVSTNCNFSFNIQQSPPSILGNNCIEKIVIK